MKKFLSVLLTGTFLLSLPTPAFAAQPKSMFPAAQMTAVKTETSDSTVIPNSSSGIPDWALYTAVKSAAKVSENKDLTVGDAKKVTSLEFCDGPQVKSLKGISFCPNLLSFKDQTIVDSTGNVLEDLGDISALQQLQTLEIDGYPTLITTKNKLKNLSPLSGLTSLRSLTISYEPITDISVLKELKGLETLKLDNCHIGDLAPLQSLMKLQSLDISCNQVKDLTPLKSLTNLKTLALSSNKFNDLAPLKNLTTLTSLALNDNVLQSIEPLTALTNLTKLDIGGDYLLDFSPLAKLTKLRELYASSTGITSAEELAKLPVLEKLSLDCNSIDDAAPLAGMISLKELDLSNNKLTDIASLAALKKTLQKLSVNGNKIDITPEELDTILPDAMKKSMTDADYKKLLTDIVGSQMVEKNVRFFPDWLEDSYGQITSESVVDLPLGATRKFGVLANVKIKGAANLCTGNGTVAATRLYKKWDGEGGSYGLYGCGKIGQVTGVYMNGQKLFAVRLIAPPFTSDTTQDVTRRVGQRYTFRVTVPYGGQVPSFTVGNGSLLSTYAAGKVTKNKDSSKNYFFGYRCLKRGRTGVYVTLGGKNYCAFCANVQ